MRPDCFAATLATRTLAFSVGMDYRNRPRSGMAPRVAVRPATKQDAFVESLQRYCVNNAADAGGSVTVYWPSAGTTGSVWGGPGMVPVVVLSPKLWPPRVTPSVENTSGADRRSRWA